MNISSSRRWVGLVFISIAVSLIIVDSTIVNVAIPSIIDDLGISSTQVQWVQESYTLVFAALLLVFGTLADRFGRRRLMLIGVAIFAASSVVAALSQSGEALIAARLVQGVGGAMVLPTTLSLINATFRGRERGIAFAVWGSTIGGMAALVPLLGGWLTTAFSWRWAFGINVPLGIIIILGVLWAVKESREERGRAGIAMLGTILFTSTGAVLSSTLDDRGVPAAERDQLVSTVVDSAGAAIAGLDTNPETAPYVDDAKLAFSDGTRYAAFSAAGFLALGFLATLRLSSGRPDETDDADEPRANAPASTT